MTNREKIAKRKGVAVDRVKCARCIHCKHAEGEMYCKAWETPDIDVNYYCDWFSVGEIYSRKVGCDT